jgi:hypothetical protein
MKLNLSSLASLSVYLIGIALSSPVRLYTDEPTFQGTETGQLILEILDFETNQAVPARVYVLDSRGELHAPEGVIVYRKYGEQHFISPGKSQLHLTAGPYSVLVERGPEYQPWSAGVEIYAGQTIARRALLKRWVSMNQLGWFSGDLHNHRKLEEMPTLLLAEDLNLAPTLTDWIWEDKPISNPPATTDIIRQVDSTHVYSLLNKEVERLEWGPGAVDLLNLKSVIPFEGDRLAPPNDRFCEQAHAQGGYVDAEKIVWRDIAALVALGHIDFAGIVHNHFNRQGVDLETEGWGMIPKDKPEFDTIAGMPLWSMEVYYGFLNCGFRLSASAGSASAVKASPLGYNRVYVKLDGPFSYENWFLALKAGRSFATNGPMLFLKVNDQETGSDLKFPDSSSAKLHVQAEASSIGNLDRLEIISRGQVLRSTSSLDSRGRLSLDFQIEVRESGWIAARCFEKPGKTIRFAHTSPVYVLLGTFRGIVPEDARYFVKWIDREMEFYRKESRFRTSEDRRAMLDLFDRARKVYSRLTNEDSSQ